MKRSVVETVLGAVVLLVALVFLAFSYKTANVGSTSGYRLSANFSGIGGLKIGDDVQISGVKIGQVDKIELDPTTFLARVTLDIDPSIKVPEDTAAIISSQSLLGGRYLALEPGGAEETIPDGGEIQFTQAPQNLEQLLGQFIFSVSGKDKEGAAEEEAPAEPAQVPKKALKAPAPDLAPSTPASTDAGEGLPASP